MNFKYNEIDFAVNWTGDDGQTGYIDLDLIDCYKAINSDTDDFLDLNQNSDIERQFIKWLREKLNG